MIRAAILDSHRKHIISNVLERHNVGIDLKCSLIPKQSLFGVEGEGAKPPIMSKSSSGYPYSMCERVVYNSESLKSNGEGFTLRG